MRRGKLGKSGQSKISKTWAIWGLRSTRTGILTGESGVHCSYSDPPRILVLPTFLFKLMQHSPSGLPRSTRAHPHFSICSVGLHFPSRVIQPTLYGRRGKQHNLDPSVISHRLRSPVESLDFHPVHPDGCKTITLYSAIWPACTTSSLKILGVLDEPPKPPPFHIRHLIACAQGCSLNPVCCYSMIHEMTDSDTSNANPRARGSSGSSARGV